MDNELRRALALRALVSTLCGLKAPNGGRDARVHVEDLCSDVKAIRDFVRMDASEAKLRSHLKVVADGVRSFLERHPQLLLAEAQHLAVMALGADIAAVDTPFFVDSFGIEQKHYSALRSQQRFLQNWQGCWRLYRPGTFSERRSFQWISRSFLNLKPIQSLERERKSVPEFAIYSAKDEHRDTEGQIVKAAGLAFESAGRTFFLGAEVGDADRVVTIVWRPAPLDAAAVNNVREGLLLAPNSGGYQVAAHCVAVRIPESVNLAEDKYNELRVAELKMCGTYEGDDDEKHGMTDEQKQRLTSFGAHVLRLE